MKEKRHQPIRRLRAGVLAGLLGMYTLGGCVIGDAVIDGLFGGVSTAVSTLISATALALFGPAAP